MREAEAEAEAEASSSSRTKSDVKIKTQRTEFTLINDDALHNILARLPASSFASAACVSKSWNQVCNRILSRPKLASALSLNPSTPIAVEEVLDKVLREPIRPHFVIATIGNGFRLIEAYQLITKRLGSSTPFIISVANGIIGRDALNNEFREVKWGVGGYIEEHGIVLTVGFVPGLKVDAIPLLSTVQERQVPLIEKFVKDVKDYTASVSGCTSPVGIIMFGGGLVDMYPFIDSLDHALPRETVIVGDERGYFLYRSGNETRNVCGSKKYLSVAIGLIFARDRDKSNGIGDIQFHVALSNGVSAVGPIYKAASVRVNKHDHTTWLTARREGDRDILGGEIILDDINDELENDIESPDLYIGVTKRRKCRIESKEKRWITSLAFHGVIEGDEEYLYVSGVNIKTGDYFQFYHSDPNIALSSCSDASVNLKILKLDGSDTRAVDISIKKEVFGGFIFSCCGRGESFFGRHNVDSSPFTENFPGVPLAGLFCGGEIGRCSSSLIEESNKESGIIGTDARTNELREETRVGIVDKFVMDIMHYTASVSGCTSPTGIIMFGDQNIDMKPVIAKMDHAMPEETAIVGDASGCFLFRSGDGSHNYSGDLYSFDAVALVFARDREKSHGIGETQFHVTLSTGVMPFGPQLTAQSVRVKGSECWLSASIEGCHEILDGQDLLDDINDVMDHDESPDLYIGVTQHRECSIGPEKLRSATSLSFYEVLGGDNQYFVVDGVGIQPGDSFLFYHSDSETASSSCANVFEDLEALKTGSNCKSHPDIRGVADNGVKKEVFGGFIFSCYLHGESYFGRPNVDSAPFFLNFPNVPLSGLFCTEEIGHDSPGTSTQKEVQEPHFGRCCLHVYSTVYLVMSYVPPPP